MSSERFSVGLIEVETQWSLNDLVDANAVLDAFDEIELRRIREHERQVAANRVQAPAQRPRVKSATKGRKR